METLMKFLARTVAAALAAIAVIAPLTAPANDLAIDAKARPQRNVTSFDPGLRCMDDMLLRFGTRDVSVMLEEIPDKTGRSGAGTRDMMVSAVSDMTRRSRAVKLVAFGVDNQNIVQFLPCSANHVTDMLLFVVSRNDGRDLKISH